MNIYGIIGYPVGHSLSPEMHNAAFKKPGIGIDAEYRKFEVKPEELEDFLLKDIEIKDTEGNPVRSKQIVGFNITVPHKVRAKEILEKEFPCSNIHDPYFRTVMLTGAVNTVKRVVDKVEYLNTDVSGFMASLNNDLGFKKTIGKSVLVIGCGGASRAVVAFLSDPGNNINKIYLYDISKEAVDSTQKHLSKVLPDWSRKIEFINEKEIPIKIETCQLLVNATPVGMKEGDPSPIDKKLLRKDLYVYDVVYNRQTQLVKDAKSLEAKAVTGEGMLVWQGALAFFCWIDRCKKAADVIDVMREALDNALKKKSII